MGFNGSFFKIEEVYVDHHSLPSFSYELETKSEWMMNPQNMALYGAVPPF